MPLDYDTLVRNDDDLTKYDAFIAPAVRRGFFKEAHFSCTRNDGWDRGLNEQLRQQTATAQTLHPDAVSLASLETRRHVAFDLCLDLFNGDTKMLYESDRWPDEKVLTFGQRFTRATQVRYSSPAGSDAEPGRPCDRQEAEV